MKRQKILVVDDDSSMRLAVAESLEICGYHVSTADNGKEALALFKTDRFNLVITDMRMPGMTGMDVLTGVKSLSSQTPVILITAYGTVSAAVEAMKAGAAEFIMKPFSLDDLESAVAHVLAMTSNRMEQTSEANIPEILTRDVKFNAILDMLRNVAKSKSSILICGESGTGKELMARYIHRNSNRRTGPFVAVNCAAIPHTLLESEMFGFEKGAFTGASQRKPGKFELASGGTLLLDEVSEMDIQLQAKLLRVIQESEVDCLGGRAPIPVDVRIIATTNINLEEAVKNKTFRGDLYYRLNVIPVNIPPLREHGSDIMLLADHFLKKFSAQNGKSKFTLSPMAIHVLNRYAFPGNVRELENIIERATLLTDKGAIQAETLGLNTGEDLPETPNPLAPAMAANVQAGQTTLKDAELSLILATLDKTAGNKTQAAKILGISVRTMWNKLHEHNIAAVETT
ncbi:MAG: sigma-54 dependent transcriptional regulator [Pseudomonadota bacterium]